MGYIECGGVVIPVIRIELADGAFLVTGQRKGPLRAYSGPVSLFGADGREVASPETTDDNHVSWPAVRRGEILTLPLPMRLPKPGPPVIQRHLAGKADAALTTGRRALTA